MSDRHFRPMTIYFPFDEHDWRALHAIRDRLGMSRGSRRALQRVLDRVKNRARGRFAMTLWSIGDVCTAVGKQRGLDYDYGDEPRPHAVGITRKQAKELMREADGPLLDFMTARGWEILETVISDHFPEHE